jgi:cytochrome d ubiquinol oxidase subunit II
MRGVKIDADMNYVGSFWDLLNVYSIAAGVSIVMMFLLHGAIYLSLKTDGIIKERAKAFALKVGAWTTIVMFFFVILSYYETDMFKDSINPGTVPLLAGIALFSVRYFLQHNRFGWAFIMTGLTIVLSTVTVFMSLFPNVMISSLNPEWSLTIYNASSSPYTLKVMTIVALTMVPIVLTYTIWTYWVFRKRISADSELTY